MNLYLCCMLLLRCLLCSWVLVDYLMLAVLFDCRFVVLLIYLTSFRCVGFVLFGYLVCCPLAVIFGCFILCLLISCWFFAGCFVMVCICLRFIVCVDGLIPFVCCCLLDEFGLVFVCVLVCMLLFGLVFGLCVCFACVFLIWLFIGFRVCVLFACYLWLGSLFGLLCVLVCWYL